MLACGVLENDLHLSLKSAHRYLVVVLASHLCFDYKSFYPSCRVPLLDQVVARMITKLKLVRVVLISFTIFWVGSVAKDPFGGCCVDFFVGLSLVA